MWHHKQNYNINQKVKGAINDVIVMECEKYLSTIILKPATILAELIKLHGMHLLKMTPNKKRPVLNFICAKLPYRKLVATRVSKPSTELPGLWKK